MEKTYSEEEVTREGMSWGEWKFSMPDNEITERLSLFCPQTQVVNPDEEIWVQLFSKVKEAYNVNQSILEENISLVEEGPMETSNTIEMDTNELKKENSSTVKDLSSYLVDVCNRLVPKIRLDISIVQIEAESIVSELGKLNKVTLISVMECAWTQLLSDESKICFCIVFSSTNTLCCLLCKHILLPWLSVNHLSRLELLSSVLAKEGDTVCVNLVAPLLQKEDSFCVRSLPDIEELMSAMTSHHWTILLKELISDIKDLQGWKIPVLAAVVQKAEPSYEELQLLVQLMSSVSTSFDQNRDFGALVAAVASSLSPNCASLVPQLKTIVNNFKGSLKVMKLKTLKILADVSD